VGKPEKKPAQFVAPLRTNQKCSGVSPLGKQNRVLQQKVTPYVFVCLVHIETVRQQFLKKLDRVWASLWFFSLWSRVQLTRIFSSVPVAGMGREKLPPIRQFPYRRCVTFQPRLRGWVGERLGSGGPKYSADCVGQVKRKEEKKNAARTCCFLSKRFLLRVRAKLRTELIFSEGVGSGLRSATPIRVYEN